MNRQRGVMRSVTHCVIAAAVNSWAWKLGLEGGCEKGKEARRCVGDGGRRRCRDGGDGETERV